MNKMPQKSWTSFNLRSLLILVTVCAVGIFAKQWWDHYQQLNQVREWIELCKPEIKKTSVQPFLNKPITTQCPGRVPRAKQIQLLTYGAIHFDSDEESDSDDFSSSIICLKILAEQYPEEALSQFVKIARQSKQPEIQTTAIHLATLYRKESTIDQLMPLLEKTNTDPRVRAAVVELVGINHASTYTLKSERWSWYALDTMPQILVQEILKQTLSQGPANAKPGVTGNLPAGTLQPVFPSSIDFSPRKNFPAKHREFLESTMNTGQSSVERIAAARALVAWPPPDYHLRYAEWGVWMNVDGQMKLAKSFLDEIPLFVHQTGNPLKSFEDRIASPIIILKPIIHMTASHAMAVDLEIMYYSGRPWYAYPKPDDFNLHFYAGEGWPLRQARVRPPLPNITGLDNKNLEPLDAVREGYPWMLPRHRQHQPYNGINVGTNIRGLGLRWQSLIISPQKQSWMKEPETGDDPKLQWWKNLRDVQCSWISNQGESEKFVFYDGPTMANAPVKVKLSNDTLTYENQPLFEHGFVQLYDDITAINKELQSNPRIGFYIDIHSDGSIFGCNLGFKKQLVKQELEFTVTGLVVGKGHPAIPIADPEKLELGSLNKLNRQELETAFMKMLTDAGLNQSEAEGLFQSWKTPLFESHGRRVVYLLERSEYDTMCQLKCRPSPTETARVGLVLTEFE